MYLALFYESQNFTLDKYIYTSCKVKIEKSLNFNVQNQQK